MSSEIASCQLTGQWLLIWRQPGNKLQPALYLKWPAPMFPNGPAKHTVNLYSNSEDNWLFAKRLFRVATYYFFFVTIIFQGHASNFTVFCTFWTLVFHFLQKNAFFLLRLCWWLRESQGLRTGRKCLHSHLRSWRSWKEIKGEPFYKEGRGETFLSPHLPRLSEGWKTYFKTLCSNHL